MLAGATGTAEDFEVALRVEDLWVESFLAELVVAVFLVEEETLVSAGLDGVWVAEVLAVAALGLDDEVAGFVLEDVEGLVLEVLLTLTFGVAEEGTVACFVVVAAGIMGSLKLQLGKMESFGQETD